MHNYIPKIGRVHSISGLRDEYEFGLKYLENNIKYRGEKKSQVPQVTLHALQRRSLTSACYFPVDFRPAQDFQIRSSPDHEVKISAVQHQ